MSGGGVMPAGLKAEDAMVQALRDPQATRCIPGDPEAGTVDVAIGGSASRGHEIRLSQDEVRVRPVCLGCGVEEGERPVVRVIEHPKSSIGLHKKRGRGTKAIGRGSRGVRAEVLLAEDSTGRGPAGEGRRVAEAKDATVFLLDNPEKPEASTKAPAG